MSSRSSVDAIIQKEKDKSKVIIEETTVNHPMVGKSQNIFEEKYEMLRIKYSKLKTSLLEERQEKKKYISLNERLTAENKKLKEEKVEKTKQISKLENMKISLKEILEST